MSQENQQNVLNTETQQRINQSPCYVLSDSQLEVAARKYCEILNLDPDSLISHRHEPDKYGVVLLGLKSSKQWKLFASKIKDQNLINCAITFAHNERDKQ